MRADSYATATGSGTEDVASHATATLVYDTFGADTQDATATPDRTVADAWEAWYRTTWVSVWIDGEEIETVVGAVTVTLPEDSPRLEASFTVVDDRVTAYGFGSWASGGREVEIYVTARSSYGEDMKCVFRGITEAISNDDVYTARGTIRAVGYGSAWLDTPVCTRVAAFSQRTRGEILTTEALAAGLILDAVDNGGTINRPWEFLGTSWWEFLRRNAECEDWCLRPELDGSVTAIPWALVESLPAVLSLTASNSFTPTEEPPSRPITVWQFSGAAITDDVINDVETIDEVVHDRVVDGKAQSTVIRTTMRGGVALEVVEEEWDTWALLGDTSPAEGFRMRSRTTTTYTYATVALPDGQVRYTPKLNSKLRVVEKYYSAETYTTDAAGTLWTDGTTHLEAQEWFQMFERITDTYTWNADDGTEDACKLLTQRIVTERFFAPLESNNKLTDAGAVNTDFLWPDGTYRDAETFVEVSDILETWSDELAPGKPQRVMRTHTGTMWRPTIKGGTATIPNPPGITEVTPEETYGAAATVVETWTATHSESTPDHEVSTVSAKTGEDSRTADTADIPTIPRASGAIAQYAQDLWSLEYDMSGAGYPDQRTEEFLEMAEGLADAQRVGRSRARWAYSVRYIVPHAFTPAVKPWARVELTDEARFLTADDAFVTGFSWTFDTLNGWHMSETRLAIPLSSEVLA